MSEQGRRLAGLHIRFERGVTKLVALTMIISIFWCICAKTLPVSASDTRNDDSFVWQKDKSTSAEIAASQSEPSLNFFDVGDLSIHSLHLVQRVLDQISSATGQNVDRSLKKSLIAIFHDTKVFSRLKDERQAFNSVGIPNDIIDDLRQRVTDDAKCLSMTRTDDKNDIVFTIILLSEKSNDCLVSGLINSFGIRASSISIAMLVDACVLYEARRLGLRDRQSVAQETSRLRNACLNKAGENRWPTTRTN